MVPGASLASLEMCICFSLYSHWSTSGSWTNSITSWSMLKCRISGPIHTFWKLSCILARSWVIYMHISVWEAPRYTTYWAALLPLWATLNLFFLGQGKWVIDVSPHLVAILIRNSKSMSNCSKLIQVSRVRQITSVGCRKKIIAVIREALLVISEESQGTRETPFFSKKQKDKFWKLPASESGSNFLYEILKGIIKQVTCQLLEIKWWPPEIMPT